MFSNGCRLFAGEKNRIARCCDQSRNQMVASLTLHCVRQAVSYVNQVNIAYPDKAIRANRNARYHRFNDALRNEKIHLREMVIYTYEITYNKCLTWPVAHGKQRKQEIFSKTAPDRALQQSPRQKTSIFHRDKLSAYLKSSYSEAGSSETPVVSVDFVKNSLISHHPPFLRGLRELFNC